MANQKEAAAHIFISERHFRRLKSAGILSPPNGSAGYSLDSVREAWINYLRGIAFGQVTSKEDILHDSEDYTALDDKEQSARLKARQAEKLELQNAQTRGELVNFDEAAKGWQGYVANCRAKLLGIPTRLAPEVAANSSLPEIQEALKRCIHEALEELSDD